MTNPRIDRPLRKPAIKSMVSRKAFIRETLTLRECFVCRSSEVCQHREPELVEHFSKVLNTLAKRQGVELRRSA